MPFLDFAKDAYDLIQDRIADVPHRRQLDRAARLAGRQLELLKPAVFLMGPTPYIGPAAQVPRGAVLVLLADSKRVCTIYMKPTGTVAAAVKELCDRLDAHDDFPEPILMAKVDPAKIVALARWISEDYGGVPGAKTPDIEPELVMAILGLLFSACGKNLEGLVTLLDAMVSGDVCPALVHLTGPASSGIDGKFCGVWPVTIGLAPYFDAVDQVAARGADPA